MATRKKTKTPAEQQETLNKKIRLDGAGEDGEDDWGDEDWDGDASY